MSNKNVCVVGAGIAGIIAAYFEALKGHNVTLIEADARAGGLLKSDLTSGGYFDYGTHILSETGEEELDNLIFSGLTSSNCFIESKIRVGNYFNNRMNYKSCHVDASSIASDLFNKGCIELLRTDHLSGEDNLELFMSNKFGQTFYETIFKPVVMKYIGTHPKELAVQSGWFFDMSRVLAFDDNITQSLDKLEVYASKLAHHTRVDGVLKYYPKAGGMGSIIDSLMLKLGEQNVDVKLGYRTTKISHDNGKISSLVANGENIEVDKLIWTLPSSLLAFLANIGMKVSPPLFRKTGLYDFTFSAPLNSLATYINVYDVNFKAGRITLYQNLGDADNFSCTVEVLADDNVALETLTQEILGELTAMDIVSEENDCIFSQFRPIPNGFPILTNKFVEEQEQVNSYCEDFFQNVSFVGRASSEVFFMKDVLIDTFRKVKKSA